MNESKNTNDNSIVIPVFGIIITLVIILIIGFVLISEYSHPEYDYLEDGLNSLDNVSDEYRQGWKDCIEELKEFNTMVSNVTDQMI